VPVDPRTPVIVGVGQTLRRTASVTESAPPAQLMAEALGRAGRDSGTGDTLLRRADSVRVIDQMSWPYVNAALEVAALIGAEPHQTVLTSVGGNSPQMVVNETARAISNGELDVALVCGAEAIYSRRAARKRDERLPWALQDPGTPAPDLVLGNGRSGTSSEEQARSLVLPVQVYPLFENALRAAAGETIDAHQVRISELWARFSSAASTNPYAWSPERHTALEIRTVSPDNRMVGFPYPKLMNANIQTDQGAGFILCSAGAATDAGVPTDRWVFPQTGADAHDHWYISDRWDLHSSPAIVACGRAALELAGMGIDDVAHLDLYSCFPSAVQMGAAALGFPLDDPDRAPTVTGGLAFAGGPGNNYVSHAIATLVGILRADPGSLGLISGIGWYATKHSIGLYSTTPPSRGFLRAGGEVQEAVDRSPRRGVDGDYAGRVTIETSTVMHERDGSASLGIVACLTPSGQRAWANTHAPDLMQVLTTEEVAGRPAVLRADGELELA
jgi:acetyl-CoA C-acetyltransferase